MIAAPWHLVRFFPNLSHPLSLSGHAVTESPSSAVSVPPSPPPSLSGHRVAVQHCLGPSLTSPVFVWSQSRRPVLSLFLPHLPRLCLATESPSSTVSFPPSPPPSLSGHRVAVQHCLGSSLTSPVFVWPQSRRPALSLFLPHLLPYLSGHRVAVQRCLCSSLTSSHLCLATESPSSAVSVPPSPPPSLSGHRVAVQHCLGPSLTSPVFVWPQSRRPALSLFLPHLPRLCLVTESPSSTVSVPPSPPPIFVWPQSRRPALSLFLPHLLPSLSGHRVAVQRCLGPSLTSPVFVWSQSRRPALPRSLPHLPRLCLVTESPSSTVSVPPLPPPSLSGHRVAVQHCLCSSLTSPSLSGHRVAV